MIEILGKNEDLRHKFSGVSIPVLDSRTYRAVYLHEPIQSVAPHRAMLLFEHPM